MGEKITNKPLTFFHANQGSAPALPLQQERVQSCETIGVPINLAFALLEEEHGDAILNTSHPIHKFLLSSALSFAVFNAIVEFVRRTDTPDAYDMGPTFARGILFDKSIKWKPKPLLLEQIADIRRRFPDASLESVETMFASMHFKRSKGICKNPENEQHDIIALISNIETGLKWFDITASDDPTRKRAHQPIPRRRPDSFEVTNTLTERYKCSCHCCNNRGEKHFFKCGKCLTARYCSKACQLKDWPQHKGQECNSMKN
jgi:hypothetical protein